jgi:hypothetical protein
MDGKRCRAAAIGTLLVLTLAGCQTPANNTDQGMLLGGVLGAGTGAIVGSAVHNPLAGAAIGAGAGALTGAVVGNEMDKNQSMIEQRMGRQLAAGAVHVEDVINMTRCGVDEELIINHIRTRGLAVPLQPSDVIVLQQQNVSKRVIAEMQVAPPPPAVAPVAAYPYAYPPPAGPVIVGGYYDPWRPRCHCRY